MADTDSIGTTTSKTHQSTLFLNPMCKSKQLHPHPMLGMRCRPSALKETIHDPTASRLLLMGSYSPIITANVYTKHGSIAEHVAVWNK